jgi:deazaflavin-dependent oxidoreductase (nitroreductase family)
MLLAKLLRQLTRLRRLQPQVGRIQAVVLRRSRGHIRRSRLLAGGQPVLALTTTGRRSGRLRTTTLAYTHHDDGYAVTALNLGSDRHPAWCLNLRANPDAAVHVAGRDERVRAREATGEEAEQVWRRFFRQLPQTANARRVTRRDVPVVVLQRTTP